MASTMMKKNHPQSSLPPGFRFHPTDEELILHYLQKKVASIPFPVSIIADVDIYKFDPWDLPGKAAFGEKEWYFFSPRDRKYPNGARPNRAAASGYWKATGTDKIISVPSSIMSTTGSSRGRLLDSSDTTNVGVKKALVFYKGRPPKGIKTNWIMHEYRLADAPNSVKPALIRPLNKDSSMRLDDWVLCRIYKKSQPSLSHYQSEPTTSSAVLSSSTDHDREEEGDEEEEQFVQQTLLPLSTSSKNITTITTPPPLMPQKSSSFSNLFDATDYSLLSSFLSDPQFSFNVPPSIESGPNDYSNFALLANQHQQQLFGSMSNGGYLHHKLPNLQYSNGGTSTNSVLQSGPNYAGETMINHRPKRERSNGDDDDDDDHVLMMMNPSKKSMNSCSTTFTNNNHKHNNSNNNNGGNGNNGGRTTSFHDHVAPTNHDYGFLNQNLLNQQQLLLSHHLQFQG